MTLALVAAALLPAAAKGDGLPLPVDDAGLSGVLSHDASVRYVTMPAQRGTVVAKVSVKNGAILQSRPIAGKFTIPWSRSTGPPAASPTTAAGSC